MDSSLIYTMILLLNVFEALARKIYNTDEKEMHFACSSQRQPKENEIIKLYLTNKNLRIRCFFQTENEVASKGMLSIFTSGGLAPSLAIVNSTYHGIFHFNLTLISDRVFWLIDIPRENITGNTDIAATEQWLVKISLHAGLNIYDTEGTLLDVVREPILQWSLGKKMKATELQTLYPYVVGLKVTKCPCANDVALIGFVLNATYNGVYIGRTFSGFWKYWETIWFNLTDLIYTELQEEHKELTLIDIVLTNRFLVILTSLGLFVSGDLRYPITPNLKLSRADFCGFEKDGGPEQFGFYYHVDPFRPMGGRFKDLVVWDGNLEQNDVSITLCKPQFDDTEHTPVRKRKTQRERGAPESPASANEFQMPVPTVHLAYVDTGESNLGLWDPQVDYVKGKLWYNERCFANREHFEVDYVTITFDRNRTLSESSSCFYSREPFLDWLPCLPYSSKGAKNTPSVITFLIDQEHNTGIYLLYNQANKLTTVSVSMLKNNQPSSRSKFPNFNFPLMFSAPAGLVFHPRSHFLYAYGDQVWLSMDGGNTFELIAELNGNDIKYSFHSFYTSDITFASKNGKIYLTKAGLTRYTVIGKITNKIFTLYYDHLGFIHKLTPTNFDAGRTLTALGNSRGIFGQPPDLGFETALAPQYISPKEIAFFAYVPVNEPKATIYKKKFKNIHQGKVIHFSKGGRVYIRNILYHKYPEGFLSSVLTEVLEPFGVEEANESSCVTSTLAIEHYNNNTYQLNLDQNDNSSFQATDVGKTVVIPGSSSFLITTVSGPKSALSLATMPESVFTNMTFPPETWFLYDFGQTNGRLWHIYTRPCQFWFQQMDDEALSLNLVKYIDLGNFQDFIIKIIPNTDGSPTREVPPVKVVVGNPTLLEVKSDGIFDDTDNYKAVVLTSNRSLRQGFTSVALMVWEASTECFVTTLVPILKSSCSYLRSMRHTPTKFIPPEDWISGIHKDSQGFNMIKTLPINYRPPSNMGIAIPLTDNFYHADPSKPIPRNLFHKSKEYGKYKQCANATTREQCNCTNDQKTSQAVAFSDCKEKVRRFKFPIQQYPVVLEIFSEGEKIPVKPPYLVTVTEVNMRKNWELKHTLSEKVRKMKDYLEPILRASVYNPSGLNLSIKIYVDEVPLPFPGHTLIAVASAVALGGLIFIAFIFQLRNIHPLRALRRCFTRNKVTLSNISVTQ